jgi:hypothetical protein|nr:MAG TPA: hypothetical protein [Caudoviricetes sp.]
MDNKDKRYLAILVNFYINMYCDSGEIYYLHKAAAEINSAIKKEGGEIFCQDNQLERKEQKA